MIGLLCALQLAAAPPTGRTADYETAAKLYQEGKVRAAARAFEAGWEKHRQPAFLFNAATSWQRAHKPVRAINLYEEFAARWPQKAARGRAALDKLARSVGRDHGRVAVQARPRGATVELEGRIIGSARWVRAGQVSIRVSHEGFVADERAVTVGAGQRVVLAIDLRRQTVVVADPAPDPIVGAPGEPAPIEEPVVVEEADFTTSWWFWTAVGAVVTGTALALALTLGTDKEQAAPPADWGVWGAR